MATRLRSRRFEGAPSARPFADSAAPPFDVHPPASDETRSDETPWASAAALGGAQPASSPLRDVPTAPVQPEARAAVEPLPISARAADPAASGAEVPARALPVLLADARGSQEPRVQGGVAATSESYHADTSQRGAASPTQQSGLLRAPYLSADGFAAGAGIAGIADVPGASRRGIEVETPSLDAPARTDAPATVHERLVLHVDIDAFFAAIEQRRNPALRGKPVIVGAGVIASCSYEARRYGLRAGMRLSEAKRLCPQVVILEGHAQVYRCFAEDVFGRCRALAPEVETYLDEAYGDLTGTERLHGDPVLAVGRLKHDILTATTGSPCSRSVPVRSP